MPLINAPEAEVFRELRLRGINLTDDQLRYPVEHGTYIGPDYATREALKYGSLRSTDERLNGMVRCWVYFCTALRCSGSRKACPNFASFLASESFRKTLHPDTEREPGFSELLAASA